MDTQVKFNSVDEYLSAIPDKHRKRMEVLRKAITSAAPEAVEVISYNMPAFRYKGILVYFAAHTAHIGFYPASAAVQQVFREELKDYETSKGTIRFPLEKAIPVNLVKKIVKFRVKENDAKRKVIR